MKYKWVSALLGLSLMPAVLFAEGHIASEQTMSEASVQAAIAKADVVVLTATKSSPTVTFSLDENPTTGYRWYVKESNDSLIDHMVYDFQAPDVAMPGKGGKGVWTVTLADKAFEAPRVIPLTLVYMRSWKSGDMQPVKVERVVIFTS